MVEAASCLAPADLLVPEEEEEAAAPAGPLAAPSPEEPAPHPIALLSEVCDKFISL